MEETVAKTKKIFFILISVIILAVCALYYFGFSGYVPLALAQSGTQLDFGVGLFYLYGLGGFMIACVAALMLVVLLLKNKRELFAKIFVWGIAFLSLLAAGGFFSNLIQLPTSSTEQVVAVLAQYVPYLAVVVASVAVLAQWDSMERKGAHLVSLVCLLVAVVFTILMAVSLYTQLKTTLDMYSTASPQQLYQVIFMMPIGIICSLVCLFYFYVTLDRRKFDCFIVGMTDEEAEIVERIEARVDEIADEMESFAEKEAVILQAEKKVEEAIEEEIKEEKVDEDTNEAAEETEERID